MNDMSLSFKRTALPIITSAAVLFLAVRCSNEPTSSSSSGKAGSTDAVDVRTADNEAVVATTATTAAVDTGHWAYIAANKPYVADEAARERTQAARDLNGMRTRLMGELQMVRDRLNNGELADEQREADKARAADLAQGLERVDRAIEAIGSCTDATWADMRQQQLKEVAEVHAWMNEHVQKEKMSVRVKTTVERDARTAWVD